MASGIDQGSKAGVWDAGVDGDVIAEPGVLGAWGAMISVTIWAAADLLF